MMGDFCSKWLSERYPELNETALREYHKAGGSGGWSCEHLIAKALIHDAKLSEIDVLWVGKYSDLKLELTQGFRTAVCLLDSAGRNGGLPKSVSIYSTPALPYLKRRFTIWVGLPPL